MRPSSRDFARLAAALVAIAGVTWLFDDALSIHNAAVVSTTYLLLVLVLAATSALWTAVTASVAAVLALNFFFLPPVRTFTIAGSENWAAFFAFLAVSIVASNLSARVRTREREALNRRDELARLFDLSRDVLLITDGDEAMTLLARSMARRFELPAVAIALPRADRWEIVSAGAQPVALDDAQLWPIFTAAQRSLEFDAQARTYSGHARVDADGRSLNIVPLRSGSRPIGLLAAGGRAIEPGTLDALGGIAAIAIERAQLLEERKAAELTRQSEQLKEALLASISHDLRTPLTSIRLAATNIRGSGLTDEERAEQADIVLAQAAHLARLFQNILEMARIDAGAVGREARWTYASEIVAGAREQIDQSLGGRDVTVTLDNDDPIEMDPRLVAAALAQVLENAAQYSPPSSTIDVTGGVDDRGLHLRVRDHGPGIAEADLPHLFERFYRGHAASQRRTGTGMGLWIARGLLGVQGGRIWAENADGGGAVFTLLIPGARRSAAAPPETT